MDLMAVLLRIDIGVAGVRYHEAKAVRGGCALEQVMRRTAVLSPGLAVRVAERAHDAFLEARRYAVSRDIRARRAAPRVVGQGRGGRRSGQRVARHGCRERGSAAEEGATVKQPVSRNHYKVFHDPSPLEQHTASQS